MVMRASGRFSSTLSSTARGDEEHGMEQEKHQGSCECNILSLAMTPREASCLSGNVDMASYVTFE